MATKLKKRRPWLTLSALVLAISVLLGAVVVGLKLDRSGRVALDYKKTTAFQRVVGDILEQTVQSLNSGFSPEFLNSESGNLIYFVQQDGVIGQYGADVSSIDAFLEEMRTVEYDYLITVRDGQVYEGQYIRGARMEETRSIRSNRFARYLTGDLQNLELAIAVRSPEKMVNYGAFYRVYYSWHVTTLAACIVLGAVGLALLTLLIVLIKHRSLRIAEEALAAGMGKIWMEAKLLLSAIAVFATAEILYNISFDLSFIGVFEMLLIWASFWWCWLVLVDLFINRKKFFTHNIPVSTVRFFRSLESRYEWLAKMKRRVVFLMGFELIAAVLCALSLYQYASAYEAAWLFLCAGFAAAGLGVFFAWMQVYHRDMDDFSKIIDYVDEIKNGEAAEPLHLEGDFASLAENLNRIHSGINRAVEEQVRSEKMKSELVTNVSHDLKTPLTSIINYVDLLGQENLQPDFANDYVKILEQKAARLKILVQDLFEISKVNSGSADMNPELLDVSALVEQTVAELDERADRAGVEIKVQLSGERLPVCADGKKLHRVFENLLGNALKYSLSGTRVYITVGRIQDVAEVAFKNISSYEMNFTAEDIVERFQRGDTSRATEGSGLGLAIAKSFVELNGGTLRIELDGDLFKAIVSLPLCGERKVHTEEPEQLAESEPQAAELSTPEDVQEAAEPETALEESAG